MPDLKIIYEDKDILAINKPAGINVHPDKTHKKISIIQQALKIYPEIKNASEDKTRPGVVHRLDRDTSGVLILAKNKESLKHLKNLFQNRRVLKTYITLLQGKLGEKINEQGIIELPIARSVKNPLLRTAKGKTRGELKPAITEYKILKYYYCTALREPCEEPHLFTLVEAYPKTGRTHQIRAHFKALERPVAGDKLYGNKKINEELKKIGLTRQFLHASGIEFTSISGTRIKIEADLPDDLKNVLEKLKSK